MVAMIHEQGRGDVSAMAEHFGVTPETIRRDLTKLERHGLIRRIHGGAIPVHRLGYEPALAQRLNTMAEEKSRIAAAAIREVPQGGSIALDAGSTVGRMAELLTRDTKLIVVTHAHPLAGTLAALPEITLHLVGGVVRPTTMAAVGPWAERDYAEVHVDVAFIGVNGISVDNGLTTPDIGEAAVKRTIIEHAQRVVVLADHTKLGRDEFGRICAIDRVDVIVTDDRADPELVAEFTAAGVEIVVS
jgi:DeoR family fructose operon transcriptional repressor